MIVISDTTPLISLMKIKRLDLLEKIFGQVFIPDGVFTELTQNKSYAQEANMIMSADFIVTKSVSDRKAVEILEKTTSLDRGESEAIILFGELKAELMLMDERRGREVALKLQIPLSGTLGVLLNAFDKGIISNEEIEEYLGEFQRQNRRFNRKIIDLVKRYINNE